MIIKKNLDVTDMALGEVEQPIMKFTSPWDDFMVHGKSNPNYQRHPKIQFGLTFNT